MVDLQKFVLKEDHGVGVTDSSGQEPLCVLAVPGRENFESWNTRVPRGEALRVLRGDSGSSAVGATENDRDVGLSARHVQLLGSRVDHLESNT